MIDDQIYVTLSIPNKEVCQIYKTKVLGWFKEKLTVLLQDTISFYDNAEAFYHGFMEGILANM